MSLQCTRQLPSAISNFSVVQLPGSSCYALVGRITFSNQFQRNQCLLWASPNVSRYVCLCLFLSFSLKIQGRRALIPAVIDGAANENKEAKSSTAFQTASKMFSGGLFNGCSRFGVFGTVFGRED